MWQYRGQQRPPYAVEPGPGQESVWDYPRPPELRPDNRRVEVLAGGRLIADSTRTVRVCETASPPTFYIPPGDLQWSALITVEGQTFCEWKGSAVYWALAADPGAWWAVVDGKFNNAISTNLFTKIYSLLNIQF